MIGLYVPGRSPIHRLPAGVKLVALFLLGALAIWLDRPWQIAVALVVVLAGYPVAGLGLRVVLRQLKPLWLLLAVTLVLQLALASWQRAATVTGTIVVLVLLAALVTLTTRTTALVDAVVAVAGPLRGVGLDPDRLGLMVALGIRCVPVVVEIATQIRDAQRARGRISLRAFAVPTADTGVSLSQTDSSRNGGRGITPGRADGAG